MKLAILSWYAYAESGAAAEAGGWASSELVERIGPCSDLVEGTRMPAQDAGQRSDDLSNPERVAELFCDARALDSDLTPQGWKYLWSHYGLQGLIDLARRGDWPQSTGDEEVADALVRESLAAGYDPVSGQFGELDEETNAFELIEA